MRELRYTLVCNGSSNESLLPILTWLIREQGVTCPVQGMWADLRRLRKPPRKLPERIEKAVDLYPCDLLFVHRDAEGAPRDQRVGEIREAVAEALGQQAPPFVCVVPVRMLEAWLLFDEQGIREAARNPNGSTPLDLPAARDSVPNPKGVLFDALRKATELPQRRLRRFRCAVAARRVVELLDDFSPLRALPAFQALERELHNVLRQEAWIRPTVPGGC